MVRAAEFLVISGVVVFLLVIAGVTIWRYVHGILRKEQKQDEVDRSIKW